MSLQDRAPISILDFNIYKTSKDGQISNMDTFSRREGCAPIWRGISGGCPPPGISGVVHLLVFLKVVHLLYEFFDFCLFSSRYENDLLSV